MITARTFVGNHQRVSLFLIYFTVWIIANWPALQQAWWTADDYSMMMRSVLTSAVRPLKVAISL